ncbi:MAG: type II secretion system F family protein [Vallitaleaceae bacterium]|nr:type II secretion system F family protein [Vallitaleaceae bacterium]
MAKFSYTAITLEGKNKKGVIEANNKERASSILKESGLLPLTISENSALQQDIVIGNPVKVKDLTIFCQQFEAILTAGVSVLEALHLLREQTGNKQLAKVIANMYERVEQGEALSASMKANSKYFPSILINMVEAGEVSGSLEVALSRMASHFEKEHRLQQSVKKATMYPLVVSIIAIAVVVLLMIVVIPTFVGMFEGMGAELPATTKALIAISDFMKTRWYVILIVAFVSIFGFRAYAKSEVGSITLSRIKLRIPIFGPVQTKIVASRFSRTMSTLLASGLPLLDAIAVVAKVVDNYVVEKGLLNAREQVSKGVALSKPIQEMEVFPPMINHMVRIGEETGQLEPILNKVADFYDREVETAVAQMTTMLEPMIIVVLAVVVGFVVISIIQPMFQMYGNINK